MTDSNSPDQDPKPFKPDPNKKLFDFGSTPPPRPLAEPDPNYDPDKADQAPATDQETLFKSAAIRCAEMEEKLLKLMGKTSREEFQMWHPLSGGHASRLADISPFDPNPTPSIQTNDRGLISHDGKPVFIIFDKSKTIGLNNKDLGIDTDQKLSVAIHSDEPTNLAFKKAAEIDKELYPNTFYYFTPDGGYKKVSVIPKQIPIDPSRPPVLSNYLLGSDKAYESEMTFEDFEIASQALQTLIDMFPEEKHKEVA